MCQAKLFFASLLVGLMYFSWSMSQFDCCGGWKDLFNPTFTNGQTRAVLPRLTKRPQRTIRLGDLSIMTWNVEEFFEPCVQMYSQWVSARNNEELSWTIAMFAKTFTDVLESDFVERHGNQTATLSMCGNMTNKMWNKGVEEVRAVISKSSADVVLLQEVAMTRLDVAPNGYKVGLLASSGEAGWKDARIGNAVLVHESLDVVDSIAIDLSHGNGAPRVAACVAVQGPKPSCLHVGACSLHLSGGRFDDALWETKGSAEMRAGQLEFLVNTLEKSFVAFDQFDLSDNEVIPWVLGGDFNAQFSPEIAKPILTGYSLYKQAVANNKEDAFLKYMTNGHEFLLHKGFRPAWYPEGVSDTEFGRDDSPRIAATSKFGAVVDWIYYPPHLMRLSLRKQQTVYKTIRQGVSDHDAIQTFFQIPAGKCKPRVVTTEMKAVWSGVGMALPSMFVMWLGYPFETIRTRQSTVKHLGDTSDIPPFNTLLGIVKIFFWIQWPARMMATHVAGVSTFIYWFAFYAAQSSGVITMRSTAISLVAACVNVVVTQPVWTVITNMQIDPKSPADTWDIQVHRIYSHNGLLGFWAGTLPNLMLVGFPVLQSYSYQTLAIVAAAATGTSDFLALQQAHPILSGISGGLATAAAIIFTYPLNVLRSRWQAGLPCLPEVHHCCEVLRSCFLGFPMKILHGLFTSIFSFAFKEQFFAWVSQG